MSWNNEFYSPALEVRSHGENAPLNGTAFYTNGVCVPLKVTARQSCYEIELAVVEAMHLPHGTLVTVLKNPANTIHGFCMHVADDRQHNARAALVFGNQAADCQGPVFLLQYDSVHHRYMSVTGDVFTEFWCAPLPPAADIAAAIGTEASDASLPARNEVGCAPAPASADAAGAGADTREATLPEVLRGLPSPPPVPLQIPLQPEASNQSMDNKDNIDDNPRPSKRTASTRKTDTLGSSSSTFAAVGSERRVRKPPTRFTY